MRVKLGLAIITALLVVALLLLRPAAQQPACDPTPTVTATPVGEDTGESWVLWLPTVWLPLVEWPP